MRLLAAGPFLAPPLHCPSTCAYVINGVWVLRFPGKGRVAKAKWKWLRILLYEGVSPTYSNHRLNLFEPGLK